VDDKIGHLIANSVNPTVGVLALPGQVNVRIAAKAANRDEAAEMIAPVEGEVRELLGAAIFGADEETMENVVGKLLRKTNKTVAVYEDVSCGLLSERLQAASPEHFLAGFVTNGNSSVRACFGQARDAAKLDAIMQDGVALTDELASCVRTQAGSDFGLALHSIPDPSSSAIQNLARGETYIALTDGRNFKRFTSTMSGRGEYDRTRMTLNAIDLLRTALMDEPA
jgi:nicotinamide-nucleotide amidase